MLEACCLRASVVLFVLRLVVVGIVGVVATVLFWDEKGIEARHRASRFAEGRNFVVEAIWRWIQLLLLGA